MNGQFGNAAQLAWTQIWQVTIAALAIGILAKLLGKRRPHLSYLLWLLVILKCLTPPIYSSPAGIFSWMMVRASPAMPSSAQQSVVEYSSFPQSQPPIVLSSQEADSSAPSPAPNNVSPISAAVPSRLSFERPSTASILGMIWLTGALVYAFLIVKLWHGWFSQLKNSIQSADASLLEWVMGLSTKLGIKRKIRILVTDKPLGPVVYGFWRPTLLMPDILISQKSPSDYEAILAHELIHIRRNDSIVGILQIIAQIIWWFHPLIWWANLQIDREKERCCDEETIARLGCKPVLYAQSLIDILKLKQRLEPVFALPGVRPGEITSKRLEEIMEPARKFKPQTPRWCWIIMMTMAILVLPGQEWVIGQSAAPSALENKEVGSSMTKSQSIPTSHLVPTTILGFERCCSVSPDGRFITDTDPETRHFVIHDLTTGEMRQLASRSPKTYDAYAAISPDSMWVAYNEYNWDTESCKLSVVSIDGSESRILLSNDGNEFSYFSPIDWSPDGKKILVLFNSEEGDKSVGWLNVVDGSLKQVTSLTNWHPRQSGSTLQWMHMSPDGRYVAYESPRAQDPSNPDIFVVDLQEKQEQPLFATSDSGDRLFGWSGDGQWILFGSNRMGSWDAWIVEMRDGRPQNLPKRVWKSIGNPRMFNGEVWLLNKGLTKDGSFYYKIIPRDGMSVVYTADFDPQRGILWDSVTPFSKEVKQDQLIWPVWSHNGKFLACSAHGEGIFVQSMETGAIKKIASDLSYQIHLRWSADDKSIWASTLASVLRIDVENDEIKSILQLENDEDETRFWAVEPASNDEKIFINRECYDPYQFEIIVHDLDSGQEKKLYQHSSLSYPIALSPDDLWLAFGLYKETALQMNAIQIISTRGGEACQLIQEEASDICWFDWSPQGDYLYYVRKDKKKNSSETTFWRIARDGGTPEKMCETTNNLSRFRFHPDGKRIAFEIDDRRGLELWAMENFLPSE